METETLVDRLRSASTSDRRAAAQQLARLGPAARPAAVALAEAAGDADEEVREWAAAALEELGAPAAEDVPRLSALLASDEPVAYWAATLLGRMEGDGQAAVTSLVAALRTHPAVAVRQRAAWALGKMGSAAAAATAALEEAALADDARLARLAGQALRQVRSTDQ